MRKEFMLKSSPFDRWRKLILDKDYLEYENKDLKGDSFTRLNKADIVDFKHEFEQLIFYKFPIGIRFSITFMDTSNKKLIIKFKKYFWNSANFGQIYSELISLLWEYYFIDIVNTYFEEFNNNNQVIAFNGIELNNEGVNFKKELITWDNLGYKEYINHFVLFRKDNPEVHKRMCFNEWNSEIIFSLIRTIKQNKGV